MKEIWGLTGELISPIESGDSGHLAFASPLDSMVFKTPYILRLTGADSPKYRAAAIE